MTIMTRSGAKFWWKKDLPLGVAYLFYEHGYTHASFGTSIKWQAVTYKQLLAEKVKKQKAELSRKRVFKKVVPAYVWVFYNNTFLFGGWHIYIVTNKKSYGINFRHEADPLLVRKAMSLFPCEILPSRENFEIWAPRFAKKYKNTTFYHGRKQGLAICHAEISEHGKLNDIFIK